MIRISSVLLALVLAVGCKKDAPPPAKPEPPKEEPKMEAPTEGVTCDKEIMLECPDGQVDGCTKTPREGDTHKCVAK